MSVRELLEEYDLELDDVRWYLSYQTALRLLEYRDKPAELARLLWSGRLEADLYDMEERTLAEWQSSLDRNNSDETRIRQVLTEVRLHKDKRYD